jgi:catechol 2,3-dioxygenase-like lactoylglutathione lyase family enzyme
MTTKQSITSIGQLVPELPVTDVERAQRHYRDALGFEIGWLHPDGIGPCHAEMWRYSFAKQPRHLLLRFTGSSPKISMRRTTS